MNGFYNLAHTCKKKKQKKSIMKNKEKKQVKEYK